MRKERNTFGWNEVWRGHSKVFRLTHRENIKEVLRKKNYGSLKKTSEAVTFVISQDKLQY